MKILSYLFTSRIKMLRIIRWRARSLERSSKFLTIYRHNDFFPQTLSVARNVLVLLCKTMFFSSVKKFCKTKIWRAPENEKKKIQDLKMYTARRYNIISLASNAFLALYQHHFHLCLLLFLMLYLKCYYELQTIEPTWIKKKKHSFENSDMHIISLHNDR